VYRYISEPASRAIEAYQAIADEYDLPLSAVALAWVYRHPTIPVCSTILGASSPQQLEENVLALNLAPVSEAMQQSIMEVWKQHMDPCKGKFFINDPNEEVVDPSTLPWGARTQDIDPELDLLLSR
jgi:aryl-alcohol dehydrogenase-like predicted oxidoreductase